MSGIISNVFKSICEEYLHPAGVKVGGYPQELFKDLSEQRREAYECRICYLLAKEAQRCCNGHLFCAACIYAWCLTSEDNVDRCPVCRQHGSYRTDAIAAAALSQESVTCPSTGCDWHGKLSDLRSHEHGLAFAGMDARSAGLPFVRSPTGEAVFPDFGDGPTGGFRATLEMERIRRRQRLARMQGHVLDGQARLSFLMSLFEEDLERRRSNLAAIASMQRRFHGQQFDQLMRLEQELGEITANLLRLIESASSETLRFNRVLQHDAPQDAAATVLVAAGQPLPSAVLPAAASASAAVEAVFATNGSARGCAVDPAIAATTAVSAASAPRLSHPTRERLLQRQSLANALGRVLQDPGPSIDRPPIATESRDRSSYFPERRSAVDLSLSLPAPVSSLAIHVPSALTSARRSAPETDHSRETPTRTNNSSSAMISASQHNHGSPSNMAVASVGKRDHVPLTNRSSGTIDTGAGVAPSSMQQRQSDRIVGAGMYNPHVITYPPHRPLGAGLPAAAFAPSPLSSYAASSTRVGSVVALPTGGSLQGPRQPASALSSVASQHVASATATGAPLSTPVQPLSARQSATVQGGSATIAQPNSIARSYIR